MAIQKQVHRLDGDFGLQALVELQNFLLNPKNAGSRPYKIYVLTDTTDLSEISVEIVGEGTMVIPVEVRADMNIPKGCFLLGYTVGAFESISV